MIPKLPLHSPRWGDLAGVTAAEVTALLEHMSSARTTATGTGTGTGDVWRQSWRDLAEGLIDDGTLALSAYAALPHLVEAAADLPPRASADFWVDLGFLVTAEDRPPVPADLQPGFSAALRLAEQAAVRSLLAPGTPPKARARLALCGVAFAGHHIAEALWRLDPDEEYLGLICPGCGSDTEIPGFFVDPGRPATGAPGAPDPAHARRGEHPWREVAAALDERALGKEWEPFLRVAREVAVAGVPAETPGPAVLCLVAATAAVSGGAPGHGGDERARTLLSLTGDFRCWDCEHTWTIADGLAENPYGARPLPHPGRTDAAATRFRQQGDALAAADGTSWGRTAGFADPPSGSLMAVHALAVVSRPGYPPLVAAAGDEGTVCLWDSADGRLVHGPLPGHPDRVRAVTALPLPDGRVLLASGGDTGTLALWDPATGRPIREPAGIGTDGVTAMCAARVPDGRTLLVTATARGAVRLWDPDMAEPVGRLNPYGVPVRSMAAIPISSVHTLIAAADTNGGVHVWDPAVEDPWDRGAAVQLSASAPKEGRHPMAAVAAVPTPDRVLLGTADNRGTVTLWDPATGIPVGDGLPLATGTAGLQALTATVLNGDRTVLVTGSRLGHRLRIWEPATGTVRHLALDVAVTCLATAGADVVVGHGGGVLRLPLTQR